MGGSITKQLVQNDVVFVGVDNAGKSTIIRQLLKHTQLTTTNPTNGYEAHLYYHPLARGCNKTELAKFSLIDLGGHEKIRGIWKSYFTTSQGVVFVFDASDKQRFEVVKETFQLLIQNNEVSRLPMLILANKQDLSCEIRTQKQFEELFDLRLSINQRFETTVGIVYDDPGVAEGGEWLFNKALDPNLQQKAATAKEELKKQRIGNGMTTEEKLKRLEEIRKRNDAIEAEEKANKNKAREAANIRDGSDVKTENLPTDNVQSQQLVLEAQNLHETQERLPPPEEEAEEVRHKPRVKKTIQKSD